jgi:hypothetical protein
MPSVSANLLFHWPALSHLTSHLNDASHRETYEPAHSVILAIFAAQSGSTTVAEVQGAGVPRPTFVEKIVPFYTRCLLEVCPGMVQLFPMEH